MEWECEECLQMNLHTSMVCEMCAAPRKKYTAPALASEILGKAPPTASALAKGARNQRPPPTKG